MLHHFQKKFTDLIEQKRLPHGILLISENQALIEDFLKFSISKILSTDNPLNHIDVFQLKPEGKSQEIKIENIRNLIEDLQKTPKLSDNKVAVIYEADRLNKNAANAFLKTLEEPPTDTTIFLTTAHPNEIIDTIQSRCVKYNFHQLKSDSFSPEIESWIDQLSLLIKEMPNESSTILKIYALLEALDKILKSVELQNSMSLLERILRIFENSSWEYFLSQQRPISPSHRLVFFLRNVENSRLLLAFNIGIVQILENILLNYYQFLKK